MGDDNKRKFEPGATMQIDLDQVQLVDLDAARGRKVPPPLPPLAPLAPETSQPSAGEAAAVPRATSVAPSRPPPAAGNAKNVMYIGLIAVVVGLAIAAGLAVGRGVGRTAGAVPSASAPPPASSAGVLEIPPTEVK
jgi:hypothetical protein